MVDINPSSETQALVVALPARCFYCALWMGEEDDPVYGVRVVAHRSCVHEQVVANFKMRYPEPPKPPAHYLVLKMLREAGVTEKELWG